EWGGEGGVRPPLPSRRGADADGLRLDRTLPAILGGTPGLPETLPGKHGGRGGRAMEATAERLKVTRTFRASRQRVFRAWTEPELMMRWFVEGDGEMNVCEIDLRVGGAYRLEGHVGGKRWAIRGAYLAGLPPERL